MMRKGSVRIPVTVVHDALAGILSSARDLLRGIAIHGPLGLWT
jgi:hypothetical protein